MKDKVVDLTTIKVRWVGEWRALLHPPPEFKSSYSMWPFEQKVGKCTPVRGALFNGSHYGRLGRPGVTHPIKVYVSENLWKVVNAWHLKSIYYKGSIFGILSTNVNPFDVINWVFENYFTYNFSLCWN